MTVDELLDALQDRGIVDLDMVPRKLDELDNAEEKLSEAMELIFRSGQTQQQGHHAQWVIDQVARILTAEKYDEFVKEYKGPDEDGEEWDWDCGIAP